MRELKLNEIDAVAGGGCGSRIPEFNDPSCSSTDPFYDHGGHGGADIYHFHDDSQGGGGGSTGGDGAPPSLPPGYTPVGTGEHYMRAADGSFHLTPQWRERVSQIHIDWNGFARDMAEITVSSIGGAGTGIRVVVGIIGGTVISAWDDLWDRPEAQPVEDAAN